MERLSRLAILVGVGIAAAAIILLSAGKLAPAKGPPSTASRIDQRGVALPGDEALCLLHNTPFRYKGSPKTWDDSFQRVYRRGARLSKDDLSVYPGTLLSSIQMTTRLTRAQLEIPPHLATLPLRGDWVVQESATIDQQMAALEKIARTVTGRNIRFEKRRLEREVILAHGTWTFGRGVIPEILLPNLGAEQRLSLDDGDIDSFWRMVQNETGRFMVNRITGPCPSKVKWQFDLLPTRFHRGQDPARQFLLAISGQTMVNFDIVRSQVDIWFVSEEPPATEAGGKP